jgi:hypothetical protein
VRWFSAADPVRVFQEFSGYSMIPSAPSDGAILKGKARLHGWLTENLSRDSRLTTIGWRSKLVR